MHVPVWLVVTGSLLVSALVGAVIGLAVVATSDEPGPAATTPAVPDADPEPTTPGSAPDREPASTTAPGDPVAGSYQVAVGEGGTSAAVDGCTPVGYEPTCEGAVHAATNYLVAVDEALVTERTSEEDFAALLDELGAGLDGDATDSPIGDLKAERAKIREESQEFDVPMFTGRPTPRVGWLSRAHVQRGLTGRRGHRPDVGGAAVSAVQHLLPGDADVVRPRRRCC